EGVDERFPDRLVGRVVDGDRGRSILAAGASTRDHPALEREQLVERDPTQRRVAPLERVRVVRRLERIGDPDEVLAVAKRLGKILGGGVTRAIERLPHGGPQARLRRRERAPPAWGSAAGPP